MKAEIILTLQVSGNQRDPDPETMQKTIKKAVEEMIATLSASGNFQGLTVTSGEIQAAMVIVEKNDHPEPKLHDCATCPPEIYDRCVTLPAHEKAKRRLAARLN